MPDDRRRSGNLRFLGLGYSGGADGKMGVAVEIVCACIVCGLQDNHPRCGLVQLRRLQVGRSSHHERTFFPNRFHRIESAQIAIRSDPERVGRSDDPPGFLGKPLDREVGPDGAGQDCQDSAKLQDKDCIHCFLLSNRFWGAVSPKASCTWEIIPGISPIVKVYRLHINSTSANPKGLTVDYRR